jgi:hypothetical protein
LCPLWLIDFDAQRARKFATENPLTTAVRSVTEN